MNSGEADAHYIDLLLSHSDGLEGMAGLGGDEYAGANCSAAEFLRSQRMAKFPDPGRSMVIFIPSHLFHPLHIDAAPDVVSPPASGTSC